MPRCCCCRRRNQDGFRTPISSGESFATTDDVPRDDIESNWTPEDSRAHFFEELRSQCYDLEKSSPFGEHGSSGAIGVWKDCSTAGEATCWVQISRQRGSPSFTSSAIEAETVQVVPELVLLRTTTTTNGEREVSGALLRLIEFEKWPEWVPMCNAVTVVQRWSPMEFLAHIAFRIPVVGIKVDSAVYINFIDRLEEEGFLEFFACSVGSTLAQAHMKKERLYIPFLPENTLLGISMGEIPTLKRAVRCEVDCACFRITVGPDGVQHRIRFQMRGQEGSPIDKPVHMLWRVLAKNFLRLLATRDGDGPGHSLEANSDKFAFYASLEKNIAKAGASAAATASTAQRGTETELVTATTNAVSKSETNACLAVTELELEVHS
eukprot:TRINITY_DN46777_c0_g1_i1.p1 TRINITY_DN46777_c0_g1~~TRINITY_DN46777_c0_g1_i1.p1  ORF type:complete len:379 (-),score=56.86 TRINITY_DN46777_c0_g1_i1:76-1212(-)